MAKPERNDQIDAGDEFGQLDRLISARDWVNHRHSWAEAVRGEGDLSMSARMVACELALTWSNAQTQRCDPSYDTIARRLGTSKDTVKRAVRDLIDAGWIVTIRGRGRSNYMQFGFLSKGKVLRLKGGKNAPLKGGINAPFYGSEKGAFLHGKGGKNAPAYNKDKHCKNTVAREAGVRGSENPMVVAEAERAVRAYREGLTSAFNQLQPWVISHILDVGLLTEDELKSAGIER